MLEKQTLVKCGHMQTESWPGLSCSLSPLASSSSHGLACIHPTWLEGHNDQQTIYVWPAFLIPLPLYFLHSWSSAHHLKSIPFPALLQSSTPLPLPWIQPFNSTFSQVPGAQLTSSTQITLPNWVSIQGHFHSLLLQQAPSLPTGCTNWYTRTPALSQKHPEAFLALWRIYLLGVKHSSCPERTRRNITFFHKPCLYVFLNYLLPIVA